MNSSLLCNFMIALLIPAIGYSTQTSNTPKSSAITVQYVNPQNFTDFSIHDRDIRYSASVFTKQIIGDLASLMSRRFPGHKLFIRFTNIDLARNVMTGPGRVRVVETNRPARLSFDYLLQDQSGHSVASGSQQLVQMPRLGSAAHAVSSGPLSLETRMLHNWLGTLSVAR